MRAYSIRGVAVIFSDETNNGFRKVLIDTQDGSPAKVDWQPKKSACNKANAAAFARKHSQYAGATLIEINIETYVNINLWEA